MKKSIVIIVFILMLGWAVVEFISNQESEQQATENSEVEANSNVEKGFEVGNLAPDIPLQTMDGEEVYLSDYRGERVMLNFWATWCPPCRAEMPDMEKFHQNTDVKIIAVNLIESESNMEQVHNFIEEYDLTFSVYLDEGNKASTIYKIQPIPTTYLINSDGTIHNKALGALNYELMVQEFDKMK